MSENIPRQQDQTSSMDKTPALSKRLLAAIPDILMTIAGDGEILTYHIPSQAPPIWQDIAQKPHLPQLMEAMTSSEECKDVLTIWSQALEGSGTGITSFSTFVAASEYRYEIRFAPMEAHRELVAIIRDVTSSYKANRELAKSEKRYRTLVENMNEGVALTDIREEILFVNDRLADIFNVDKEGLIGTTSYSLFSDPKIQDIIKSKIPGRKGGSSETYELDFRRKDGKKMCILIAAAPHYGENGEYQGAIALVTDISDRKQAELKLIEKNQELDAFVYKASHDLKGPLASILGVIHIARDEIQEATAHKYLDLITRSTKRLDLILSELIDLTRLNKSQLALQELNMEQIIDEIVSSLKHLPHADKINYHKIIQLQNPLVSDIKLIHSIIQNLTVNAINYHNFEQQNPKIIFSVVTKGEYAAIKVEDNGIGIPMRLQKRVFEMFYRGNTQSKGSGLGLYIVKSAVDRLKGEIDLESEEGKGTGITIRIPQS